MRINSNWTNSNRINQNWLCINLNYFLLYEGSLQKYRQTDVWKWARLSVLKQNWRNTKNKNILNWLTAVIHKNKRDAAGNSKKVVNPCSMPFAIQLTFHTDFSTTD